MIITILSPGFLYFCSTLALEFMENHGSIKGWMITGAGNKVISFSLVLSSHFEIYIPQQNQCIHLLLVFGIVSGEVLMVALHFLRAQCCWNTQVSGKTWYGFDLTLKQQHKVADVCVFTQMIWWYHILIIVNNNAKSHWDCDCAWLMGWAKVRILSVVLRTFWIIVVYLRWLVCKPYYIWLC